MHPIREGGGELPKCLGGNIACKDKNSPKGISLGYYSSIVQLQHRANCCFVFVCISLTADGPQRARLPIPRTATLPSCLSSPRIFTISPRLSPHDFLSRCKFNTLTTRQPIVVFYLFTFSRFPLRKPKRPAFVKGDLRV